MFHILADEPSGVLPEVEMGESNPGDEMDGSFDGDTFMIGGRLLNYAFLGAYHYEPWPRHFGDLILGKSLCIS